MKKDILCRTLESRLAEIERKLQDEDESLYEELEPFIILIDKNSFILLTFFPRLFDIAVKLLGKREVPTSSADAINRLVDILKNFNSTIYAETDWLDREVKCNIKNIEIELVRLKKALEEYKESTEEYVNRIGESTRKISGLEGQSRANTEKVEELDMRIRENTTKISGLEMAVGNLLQTHQNSGKL